MVAELATEEMATKGGIVAQAPAAKLLGRRLRELRDASGHSQSYVDRYFDWPDNTTFRLEAGNTYKFPPPDQLRALAKFYGVTVQHLLECAGYTEPPEAA